MVLRKPIKIFYRVIYDTLPIKTALRTPIISRMLGYFVIYVRNFRYFKVWLKIKLFLFITSTNFAALWDGHLKMFLLNDNYLEA